VPDSSWDGRPADDLITRALALDGDDENDDDEYWAIVLELQRRGDRETFAAARALCLQESDDARCLGVSVLARLGSEEDRPFLEETLPLLRLLCDEQASDDLLAVAVGALGLLGDPRGAPSVLAQRSHPSAMVRLAVAQSAEGVGGEPPDPDVLAAVMLLMEDDDDAVRDWATFSLGSLFEADSPRIRSALYARIDDPDEGVSAEALAGLAARDDERVVGRIQERLEAAIEQPFEDPHVEDLIVESAARLGDSRFLPALRTLHARESRDDARERLGDAIASCEAP
jgi:HEAT repeat protein